MLATDPSDAIGQMTELLNAVNVLTAGAQTLANATLPPLSPPPDWYQTVEAQLQASQKQWENWLANTGPNAIDEITSPFIHYATTFANVYEDVDPILNDITNSGKPPTKSQVSELSGLFGTLEVKTNQNNDAVKAITTDITKFQTELNDCLGNINTALASAMPAEAAELAAVQQVQTQLQSAEVTLAAENQAATDDTISTAQAMSSLAIGLTMPGFQPIAFGIAIVGIGADIAVEIGDQNRVLSNLAQIESLSDQLSEDQMQLGLMQGLVLNLQSLAAGLESALAACVDSEDTWSFANYGLQYLNVVLAQPQIDISKIPDLDDLDAASAAWQQAADYATKVQDVPILSLKTYTISPSS